MPSAEQTTTTKSLLIQDGYCTSTRDVDALVSRIKENLRLQSGQLKSRSSLAQKGCNMRAAPYKLPPNSSTTTSTRKPEKRKTLCSEAELEDSYERFQALLRKGSLIKEAVKRLEEDELDEEDYDDMQGIRDSVDDDSSNDDFLYPRNRSRRKQRAFYYDSEDEELYLHHNL